MTFGKDENFAPATAQIVLQWSLGEDDSLAIVVSEEDSAAVAYGKASIIEE